MQYLLLAILTICVSAQSIFKKHYSTKTDKPNKFFFSAMTCIAELIFFLIIAGFKVEFVPALMPYSIGFAICFAALIFSGVLSLKWGPMAITVLIGSYSLLIPTLYGIFVMGNEIKTAGIAGLVLLLISLTLIGVKKEKLNFSLKWLIAVIVGFVSNGICSILLNTQQADFNGLYKNEFMIFAMIIATVILLIISLLNKEKITEKFGWCATMGVANGVSNAIVNLLVMVLVATIPGAILFPCVSAGGIVLGFVMATTVYKEKLSPMQLVGYFLGVVSVVLLNIK